MNTEKLIQFFTKKLEKIPELQNLNRYDEPEFATWWNTITSTCERMGQSYKQRADRIRFFPGVVIGGGDNSAAFARAYHSGLNNAEALIKSIIEELEMWGYESDDTHNSQSDKETKPDNKVILNLTISQQQAQQITQTINLSQYDEDVQLKVQELLEELKKETKNKSKIIEVVKWLADKGVDALIALLLAATKLT